jgi:hypothetical protein
MFGREFLARAILALPLLWSCTAVKPIERTHPLHGSLVEVHEFDMSGAYVTDWVGPTEGYGILVAEEISKRLRVRGVSSRPTRAEDPEHGDVIVEGRILVIDGGSRALRYWIGWGAGSALCAVAGQVSRSNGEVLGTFSTEAFVPANWLGELVVNTGSVPESYRDVGGYGGDYKLVMEDCAVRIGVRVAEMIANNWYKAEFSLDPNDYSKASSDK